MAQNPAYDSSLQMFVTPPQPLDFGRLIFLRALIDTRRLEHCPSGPPSGPVLEALTRSQLDALVAAREALRQPGWDTEQLPSD